MSKNLNELFGIDAETLEKSKNITPTLDLGAMEDGATIKIEFIEKEPREVETPNSKFSKVSKIINVQDENGMRYGLWLSAKTLRLGVAKLWSNHSEDLVGVKAIIKKTTATFKEFGENVAYNIQEIEEW